MTYSRRVKAQRILVGVTAPQTATAFLRGHLRHLRDQGWEVHLLCGAPGLEEFAAEEGVTRLHLVPADRNPSRRDPLTFMRMLLLMLRLRPSVALLGTPKVGVLGTVAAWVTRVPRRVYLVHGYRAEGLVGRKRTLMRTMERAGCAAATDVVAVSHSLRALLVAEGVARVDKVRVPGHGSANGVDLTRFRRPSQGAAARARESLGVPVAGPVLGVVGRVTRDKGLQDLPAIWRCVHADHPAAWLVVVGTAEVVGAADAAALQSLRAMPQVRVAGELCDVERAYAATDVLLLLSKREGLGMVALEAAACGIPTVGYAVTGVVDAVEDGRTGLLLEGGDVAGVARGVSRLLADADLRRQLGEAAARRVEQDFAREQVWRRWDEMLVVKSGFGVDTGGVRS